MTDLEGKVALVVGASRGIGRAIARDPATRGADLAPTATSREGVERTASECRSESVGVLSLALDMSHPSSSESAVNAVLSHFGRFDALVVSAAINPYFVRPESLTTEAWDEVMNLNLRGTFFCVQAAARHTLPRESGTIALLSSATANVGIPRGLPYTATKGGD